MGKLFGFLASKKYYSKGNQNNNPTKQDPFVWPIIPEEAKEKVMELLNKGEISVSDEVDKFADDFKKYIGVNYCIPENNGTAALHSAFFSIGVQPGDEVISPSYTYWATAMPAAALGARLVFAESDPNTLNISAEDIAKKITPKTKAIVIVHLWGLPCDMDAIMKVAKDKNVPVIEDASHAHGSEFRGKKIGTFGDISCFSFQGTKLIPAGEAGMMLTNNKDLFEKGICLGHYERAKKLDSDMKRYGNTGFGFKYRMSPLHAAIGRVLLKDFGRTLEITTANAEKMRRMLGSLKGFINYEAPQYVKRVHFENVIKYDEKIAGIPKAKMLSKLSGLGFAESRYPLLHQQPYYVEKGSDPNCLPITQDFVTKLVKFPMFRIKDDAQLESYLAKVQESYSKI
jgi:perosamine synthetase